MKRLTLLSVVTAMMLLNGCGNDAKQAVSDAASKAAETVKEGAAQVADTAKETASKAVEATKEAANKAVDTAAESAKQLAETATEKAANAAAAVKETAANAAEAASNTATKAVEAMKEAAQGAVAAATGDNALVEKGKSIYSRCAACHGFDGKTKALGVADILAGQSVADIEKKLHGYKAGTRNDAGKGMLMKGQVAAMSDEDIKAVAAYIATLK